VIETRSLSFAYPGEPQVLHRVSLRLPEAGISWLVGANGSGKTTLIYCLGGLIPHVVAGTLEGDVVLFDMSVAETPFHDLMRKVGLVFEDPESQFVSLRVRDELIVPLTRRGMAPREAEDRAHEFATALDIERLLDRAPDQLSMGEKQRVALAAALVQRPQLLVLDEPAKTLDASGRRALVGQLRALRDGGVTAILSSHSSRESEGLADFYVGLRSGEAVVAGPATELSADSVTEIAYGKDVQLRKARSERSRQAPGDVLLDMDRVTFRYRGCPEPAINNASIGVRENEFVCLVGPNGCGKSTFLSLLAGLLRPQTGQVRVERVDVSRLPRAAYARSIGYLFQNPNHQLFARTIQQELLFGLKFAGMTDSESADAIDAVRSIIDFSDWERDPRELSFGQRKLVCLASLLARAPRVLLLDEPELGLDVQHVSEIVDALVRYREQTGCAIVAATHDLDLVESCADRIVFLDSGNIVASGEAMEELPRARQVLSDD